MVNACVPKKSTDICFGEILILILRIEFIDTETSTMYKKLRCEKHRYIFYCILKFEVTFNIISILLLYMDEYVYTSSLNSKKCCF